MSRIRQRGAIACGIGVAILAWPALACAAAPARVVDDLVGRAQAVGEIRVIVQLQAPHVPVGQLRGAGAFRQRQSIQAAQQIVAAQTAGQGAREQHRFRHIPFSLYVADAKGIERLGRLPQVVGLQEDLPEDPLLDVSAPIVGAPAVWSQGEEGDGQVIVILDTGIDPTHPFFGAEGKIVAEACYSTNSETHESLCPGGAEVSLAPGSGANCPGSVNGCNHGTHVGGIAAGNDGVGPRFGIAREADLISVQVFSRRMATSAAQTFPADQIEALEQVLDWAETYPIAAVNMSLGGTFTGGGQAECEAANAARKAAIDNLRSVGIPTVIAAGNSGSRTDLYQPACISTAISVGATTSSDVIWSLSNVSDYLDFLAPGANIGSSVPGGGIDVISGTSMATPHVAGAWAVLRSAVPLATLDEIATALTVTATLIDDLRSNGVHTDMPRINLDLALAQLRSDEAEFDADPSPGSEIDLGAHWEGQTTPEAVITVSNHGGIDLTLECGKSGADTGSFIVVQCPATVPPQGTAELRLACSPLAEGELSASLDVTTNDLNEGNVSWPLSCEGLTDVMFEDSFEAEPE